MDKKILLTVAATTIIGVGLATTSAVFAQNNDSQNPMASIVQKIADKFGLKKDEVQAVFDVERQERQAQMQAKYEEQVSQWVKDGKITEAQKAAILEKHKELQAAHQSRRDEMRTMTADERKAAMDKERQALEAWAKEQGIDMQYVMGFGMGERGGRFGGHKGPKQNWNTTPSAPSSSN